MVLCTLFIHINIIPTRQKIHLIWTEYYSEHNVYVFALAGAQKIHLIWTEYYSEHNVYVFALAGAWTPIAWVRVHHANHYTTKASQILGISYHVIIITLKK